AATSLGVRYQREILSDRSGLDSERASLDARTLRFAPVALEGALDWDFAFGRVGRAHLAAEWRPPSSPLVLEASVRRYLPYFELSTIWGFFSPVPYHEAGVRASWSAASATVVWARAARRRYGDAEVATVLSPLEDQGWQVSL